MDVAAEFILQLGRSLILLDRVVEGVAHDVQTCISVYNFLLLSIENLVLENLTQNGIFRINKDEIYSWTTHQLSHHRAAHVYCEFNNIKDQIDFIQES